MRRICGHTLSRGLFGLVLLGLVLAAAPERSLSAERRRPNVLVILTDDQAIGTLAGMPQTRAWLKRGGTEFTSAFATTPQCCPSRASIMTGLYAHNHGVRKNNQARKLPSDITVQHKLRSAGYHTAIFGKFLNEWDTDVPPPDFDEWAVFGRSMTGYTGGLWNLDGRVRRVDRYGTAFLAARTARFLWERRESSRPWMAFVSTAAPHTPAHPQARYANAAVPEWQPEASVFETDEAVDETLLLDKPEFVRRPSSLAPVRAAAVREAQLRSLYSVDDLVGRLHRVLSQTEQDENTLVIFLSDNGFLWGQHGRLRKAVPYLPAVRVPMLARWDGHIPAGRVEDRLVATIDIAPTIFEAARLGGVAVDGRSLLSSNERDRLLLEYWHQYQNGRIPSWASIITAEEQYVEYYAEDQSVPVFKELYDLHSDPHQLLNRLSDVVAQMRPEVADGAHERAGRLAEQLNVDRTCAVAACP